MERSLETLRTDTTQKSLSAKLSSLEKKVTAVEVSQDVLDALPKEVRDISTLERFITSIVESNQSVAATGASQSVVNEQAFN